jgi:methionyl-tRNA synthetase
MVLFSYVLPQFAFALLVGELAGSIWSEGSPFEAGSAALTVATGGIDNVVHNILGNVGLSVALPQWRPYDSLLVNYFVNLEGEKFSTSGGHVISVDSILSCSAVDSDAVRYYLASLDPREGVTNFSVNEFIRTVETDLVGGLWSTAGTCARELADAPPGELDAPTRAAFTARLNLIASSLRPSVGDTRTALVQLREWVETSRDIAAASPYWWLKLTAILACPITPDWAERTWHRLGIAGTPRIAELECHGPVPEAYAEPARAAPTRAGLASALPDSTDRTDG